jgi:hypothetical protein
MCKMWEGRKKSRGEEGGTRMKMNKINITIWSFWNINVRSIISYFLYSFC